MQTYRFTRRGAALVMLIVSMVIAATLGAATLYLTSSASFTELFSNNQARAYYLAESGGNYAKPLVQSDIDTNTTTNITALNGNTFTLGSGKFVISIDNSMPALTLLNSTGIVNQGSWLEGKRKVTYGLMKPFQEPFNSSTFSQNWSVTSGAGNVAAVGPSGGDPALRAQAPGGNTGNTVATIGFKWDGALGVSNPGMPDLYSQWLTSNNLLSYQLQVKAAAEYQGTKGSYYMLGLSFRLNTYGDLDSANDTSYGVSFFKSQNTSNSAAAWLASLDSNFTAIRNGNVYIVFWKRPTQGGTITLLDYAPLFPRWAAGKVLFAYGTILLPTVAHSNGHSYICTTAGGCTSASSGNNEPNWPTAAGATVNEKGGGSGTWQENGSAADTGLLTASGTLANWSALAVKLEEKFCTSSTDTVCSATSGTRSNFVTIYTAQADVYPRGLISWDYATYFKPVKWTWHLTGQLLANAGSWASPPTPATVLDGSLTSNLTYGANPVVKPVEIGIHGFYDTSASNDMFFDDFALKLPTTGGGGSSGSLQW